MATSYLDTEFSGRDRMVHASPIAKRLKEARVRAGLSQRQLGILAGIDAFSASPRINQYERGKHTPDYPTACRLAAVLKIPTPFLYAEHDTVAEWILLTGMWSARELRGILKELQQRTEGKRR